MNEVIRTKWFLLLSSLLSVGVVSGCVYCLPLLILVLLLPVTQVMAVYITYKLGIPFKSSTRMEGAS